MRALELGGQRFSRLVVLGRSERVQNKISWLCQCDCGNKVKVTGNALKSGNTKSCGCIQRKHPPHTRGGRGGPKRQARLSMIGYKKPHEGEWILREGWYWPDAPCRRGHIAPRNRFTHCMQCIRDYRKANGHFAQTTKDWVANNRQKSNLIRRRWAGNNYEKQLVNSCRSAAKKKGLPFDLTVDDIVIPEKCPIFGFPLSNGLSTGKRNDASPSIDRIIPTLGYVRGNIAIISWRANRIKCDASVDELEKVANFYRSLATKD